MKSRILFFLCISAILLLSACKKNEISEEKPIYNTKKGLGSENSSSSGPIDNTSSADDLGHIINPDFKGITPGGDAPKTVNSPFSNIYSYGTSPILCYDEEGDILYYVKYGGPYDKEKDYFLYSYKEGVSELIIDMPVNYPNYLNGSIYFTSNEDIDALYAFTTVHPEGKLYRYDVMSKEIELMVDENIFNLVVYEDYIYYTTSSIYEYDDEGNYIQKGWENYRLSVSGGEPEPMGDFLPYFYGEYQLRRVYTADNSYFMELVSENDAIRITGYVPYFAEQTFCIAEDKFWFKYTKDKHSYLISVDLRNGEAKIHKDNNDTGIMTYVVYNDELIAYSGSRERRLVRYDSKNEAFIPIKLSEPYASPNDVLADGKHLYVTYDITDANAKRHWFLSRMIPTENGSFKEEVIYR